MRDIAKTILRASLTPDSLILGLAVCNFIVVWVASSRECMGYICPWYYAQAFAASEPTRLLVAASLLRVRRAWGYSAAIALGGFMLIENLTGYFEYYDFGTLLESLRAWKYSLFLSLHTQNLMAGVILVYAAVAWGRSAIRRGESLR